MVSFQCDQCQETVKKPKLDNHLRGCGSWSASCLDCGKSFTADEAKQHTQCISEAQKYQGKLFKGDKTKGGAGGAGGAAAGGKRKDTAAAGAAAGAGAAGAGAGAAAGEPAAKKQKAEKKEANGAAAAAAAAAADAPVLAAVKAALAGTGSGKPAVSLKALKKQVLKQCVPKPRTDDAKAKAEHELFQALLSLPIAVGFVSAGDD